MNSSSSFSSISLSLIHKRSRSKSNNNAAAAVEGAGAAATAAAAAALAAVEDWKLKLQQSLARRLWESPLMKGHKDLFDRLFAAELRHAEALEDLRLQIVSLAGVSVATSIIGVTILLRTVQATGVGLDWSRLGGTVACIAAMFFFGFLTRRR